MDVAGSKKNTAHPLRRFISFLVISFIVHSILFYFYYSWPEQVIQIRVAAVESIKIKLKTKTTASPPQPAISDTDVEFASKPALLPGTENNRQQAFADEMILNKKTQHEQTPAQKSIKVCGWNADCVPTWKDEPKRTYHQFALPESDARLKSATSEMASPGTIESYQVRPGGDTIVKMVTALGVVQCFEVPEPELNDEFSPQIWRYRRC